MTIAAEDVTRCLSLAAAPTFAAMAAATHSPTAAALAP